MEYKNFLKEESKKEENKNKTPKEIVVKVRNVKKSKRRMTLDGRYVRKIKGRTKHIKKLEEIEINYEIKEVLLYSNKKKTKMIFRQLGV